MISLAHDEDKQLNIIDKFKVGDKVRYIYDNELDSVCVPPKGTTGTIVEIDDELGIILVEWPESSGVPYNYVHSGFDWWANPYNLELVD